MRTTYFGMAIAALGFVMAGCGGSSTTPGGVTEIAFLSGTVMVGGTPARPSRAPGDLVPLANAEVDVVDLDTNKVVAEATTDANGVYEVNETLAEGNYIIEATSGETTVQQVVSVDEDDTKIERDVDPLTTVAAVGALEQFKTLKDDANEAGLGKLVDIEDVADELRDKFEDKGGVLPDLTNEDEVRDAGLTLLRQEAPSGFYAGEIFGDEKGVLVGGVFAGTDFVMMAINPRRDTPKAEADDANEVDEPETIEGKLGENGTVNYDSPSLKIRGFFAGGVAAGHYRALDLESKTWLTGKWKMTLQTKPASGAFEIGNVDVTEAESRKQDDDGGSMGFVLDSGLVLFEVHEDNAHAFGQGELLKDGTFRIKAGSHGRPFGKGVGSVEGDTMNLAFTTGPLSWQASGSRFKNFDQPLD